MPHWYGACRRVLPDEADCEDAFQATFLALIRQAPSIDPRRALGGWLHTVAVRVSRKALARSWRQRTGMQLPDRTMPGDVAVDVGSRELFRLVDEEIERLPAASRAPIILCCLQGRTRDEAAEVLGCSVATVRGRLERGRSLLRRRLGRRGIELPAAFLVLGLTGGRVRASLGTKTIQSALDSPTPAVAALVPASALSLTGKLTLAALSLLAVGVLGWGAFHATQAGPPAEDATQNRDISSQPPVAANAQPLRDRFGDPLPAGAVRRFGTLRFRHDEIHDLAFTPDGKQLIAGCGRTPLAVFDTSTGRKLREVGKTSPNNPHGFALSPDGKRVACCGYDVYVWELGTGKLLRELGCGRCQAVAFSPDGTKIAAVKEFQPVIYIIESATGKKIAEWTVGEMWRGGNPRSDLRSIAFSPDGKYVVGLFREFRPDHIPQFEPSSSLVRLWDIDKGTLAGSFGSEDVPVRAFAFQPGTNRLATLGKDGFLRFWDLAVRKEVQRIETAKGSGLTDALSFSADGRRCLVYHSNGLLSLLDAKDGKELRRIQLGEPSWRAVAALSPDGQLAASGKLYGESCVRVWDLETGREKLAESGHRTTATLSLSTDGRTLVSRDAEGRVFHWNPRTGEGRLLPATVEEEVGRPMRTPMATTLRGPRWRLTIDEQAMRMEVRSLDGSRLLGKATLPEFARGYALSPDGAHLAVAFQDAQHTVFLWNPEKEDSPRLLQGHPDACQLLLFSHDSKRLIAGAGTHNRYRSETVWVWDVATAQIARKLATNSAPGYMLLTADDRVLITGGLHNDAAVRIWDMLTGKQLAELADPSLPVTSEMTGVGSQLAIAGLALSADERFLAVNSVRNDTSSITVWETASWKPVRAFDPTRPRNYTRSMLFSRDDRSVFVANSDSTILEWDIAGRRPDDRRRDKALTPHELETCWTALADKDAAKAYAAVWALAASPEAAVPFLHKHLSAVSPPDVGRVARLLAELEIDDFKVRQRAAEELSKLGDTIIPLLRRALEGKPPLETRRRVQQLLDQARDWTPERLRDHRAIQVLERIGTLKAKEMLEALARGVPEARRTVEAKAALRYLAR